MSKTIFRELLDKEASPALGCTEPMMFALGGAITRKHAPGKVLRVDMVGCGLMVRPVARPAHSWLQRLASSTAMPMPVRRYCTTSPPRT